MPKPTKTNEFAKELVEARKGSRWPHRVDFAERGGFSVSTYEKYEDGERFPSTKAFEKLMSLGVFHPEVSDRLRKVYNEECARRAGVELPKVAFTKNMTDLSESIVNDVEYELKKQGIRMTQKTKNVCIRRISLRLQNSVEES